jgi:flagellar basal body rod protein FlgF
MALNYLLDPVFQIENSAGKPATDGWLEVYIHGTRTKYYCASDFNGTLHPFKIKLDSLGSNIVLAEDGQAYDVYAYNRFGSLLMSRYNVTPGKGGGSGGNVGEMQHWLGMYGPTYTPFPGDNAGHTLGISKWEVDYVGDFIDHISTCPYPDGTTPSGYIYLKPGLYYVSCIIRYQQASDALSNTLDEILIYTGAGNANESLAYQMDSSGPEATGNRHNIRVQFIRRVPDNVSSGILYFAPGTPVDWKEAYIQKLEIVKLDSVVSGAAGIRVVYHDETMTGEGTQESPLSIQGSLNGKQDKLTEGQGIHIDSDGVISAEGEKYYEGWGINIDSDNEISVDPSIIQEKLTPGEGITIDSDGVISTDAHFEQAQADFAQNDSDAVDYIKNRPDLSIYATKEELTEGLGEKQDTLTPGEGISIDSDGVISATNHFEQEQADFAQTDSDAVDYIKNKPDLSVYATKQELEDKQDKLTPGNNITIDSDGVISAANGETYTAGDHINIDADNVISATGLQEELTAGEGIDLDSDGNISVDPNIIPEVPPIIPLVAGDNITIEDSDGMVVISAADGGEIYTAGEHITIDSDGTISTTGLQEKLTAGQNITIDSDGVISAVDKVETYTAGENIVIDSDNVISAPGLQKELTADYGINLDSDGNIGVDPNIIPEVPTFIPLVAGENINIEDSDGSLVISASGGGGQSYTAGAGILIDSDGVISIDPQTLPAYDSLPIEAGNGISIDVVNGKLRISVS